MQLSELPKGIDIAGLLWRGTLRHGARSLKRAIGKLAAESLDVEQYDAAIGGFMQEYKISYPRHSGRPALDRLLRLYVRHYRRELSFLQAAARHALLAAHAQ